MKGYKEKLTEDQMSTGMMMEEFKVDYRLLNYTLKNTADVPKPIAVMGKINIYNRTAILAWIEKLGGIDKLKELVHDVWADARRAARQKKKGTVLRKYDSKQLREQRRANFHTSANIFLTGKSI